ncbi:MAG: hypothetical protein WA705_12145 [Candidatus Ozemobacteraceae bacterium]
MMQETAFSENQKMELFLYWISEVGNDLEDIKQPFCFIANHEEAKAIKELGSSDKVRLGPLFKDYVGLFCIQRAEVAEPFVDTKAIAKEFFTKVLNRRQVLVNNIMDGKQFYPGAKFFFPRGINAIYGYLEFVQITVLQQLIANRDLRFGAEANALLAHLYSGKKVPPPFEENIRPSQTLETGYAFCWNPSRIAKDLIYYLELCKESGKN